MQLSVVVPAYNEEGRIRPTLERIASHLAELGQEHEILVVDDGSTDATVQVVGEIAASWPTVRILRQPENRGKGAAIRAGVLASTGEEVLFSDADLATPIEELAKLRQHLQGGCDIAIGSRAVTGADIRVRQSVLRMLMGKTFNRIVRLLVVPGISDTQCGFKLFRGAVARELFAESHVDGFAFDVEILLLARGRYRVAEVPVVWRHVEESKVALGRHSSRMLLDVIRLRWRGRKRGAR